MPNFTRYIGLDIHKETIAVAVCDEAGHTIDAAHRSEVVARLDDPPNW